MDFTKPYFLNINNRSRNIPFIYQLWIITNSEKNNAIKWGPNGDLISINSKEMVTYLKDELNNIFTCKILLDFYELLEKYGFKKFVVKNNFFSEGLSECENDLLDSIFYKNSNFQKGRFDLLKNILLNSHSEQRALENKLDSKNSKNTQKKPYNILDPTYQLTKNIKTRTKKQNYLTLTLKQIKCLNILQKRTCSRDDSIFITIPSDIFNSPSDSISGFEEKLEYAGFYGEFLEFYELQKIFDTYLPVYLQTNDCNTSSTTNQKEINPSGNRSNINNCQLLTDSINSNATEAFSQLTSDGNQTTQSTILTGDLAKATPLEPIFNQDLKAIIDSEDDISMEEYLRFNKKYDNSSYHNKNENNNYLENNISNTIAAHADIVKNEIKITSIQTGNETEEFNFKSFFSEYSKSVNVLLEQ